MDTYEKRQTLIFEGAQQTRELSLKVSETLAYMSVLQSILPWDIGEKNLLPTGDVDTLPLLYLEFLH